MTEHSSEAVGTSPPVTPRAAWWSRISTAPSRQRTGRYALAAAAGLIVFAVAAAIEPAPAPAADAVVALVAALAPPELALALFFSSPVWKTDAIFGAQDSPFPTIAILAGWSIAVLSRPDAWRRVRVALRAAAILAPLIIWLFVSSFISGMGRSGYLEALRFLAVVLVPAVLLAAHLTPKRVASYVTAIAGAGAMIALAALASSAVTGRLGIGELVLFRENQVAFARVVATGFIAALCLFPLARAGTWVSVSAAALLCASAVAFSTSRTAAITALASAVVLLAFAVRYRWTASGRRVAASTIAAFAATVYLVIVAVAIFPTDTQRGARGVRTLAGIPNELPQFVNVPLMSESLPSGPRSASAIPSSQPASPAPSAAASLTPSPTRDPALVAYAPDLSLAYRIERYRVATAQFISSPLVGVGYTHGVLTRDGQDYAHNIFLEVAGELGIVGLVCLGLVLFAATRELTRRRRDWRFGVIGALTFVAFVGAQTGGDLTINRMFFIGCVALVGLSSWARGENAQPLADPR